MNRSRRVLILGGLALALGWGALVVYKPCCSLGSSPNRANAPLETPPNLSAPNPIPLSNSLELEEMTWMEVRDRIAAGYTRVIVPTGGIEQNGPFVSLQKHDLIAKTVSLRTAKVLGSTIVAPVVSFVPEGNFDPPSGHMRYPGTISLSPDTFQRVLQDLITSLSLSGFREIIIVGDSGDSQGDIARATLQRTPRNTHGAEVRYIPQFYDYESIRAMLKKRGLLESPAPFHEELAFSLQLLAIDPSAIRYEERMSTGNTELGGISLRDKTSLIALGEEIIQWRAENFAAAIRAKPPI
jgi:creatinine amidohydrolase